jgi:hypothetical protein
MIYAPEDKNRCATSQSRAVRPVANIVREPQGPTRLKVFLVQEANINAMPMRKCSSTSFLPLFPLGRSDLQLLLQIHNCSTVALRK